MMDPDDQEVSEILCPKIAALSSGESLSSFLQRRGFTANICQVLEENMVDGKMFLQLSRSDLKDLFQSDFPARKKIWDFISSMGSQSLSPTPSIVSTSSIVSNTSTMSPNSSFEEDIPLSQVKKVPQLKRTKPREFEALIPPVKKSKHGLLGEDFKLPITSKIGKLVANKTPLDDATRRQLIRDCVTCLETYVGKQRITSNHFTEVAQRLCQSIPLLRDEKPPSWPDELEFEYWASTKHLLRKRYSNVKSSHTRMEKEAKFSAVEVSEDQSDDDVQKHEKELKKEVGKKAVNWKAVEQLQALTFSARWEKISKISGLNAVEQVLEQFLYFDKERVLLQELELHISKLTKTKTSFQTFFARWATLSKCFVVDEGKHSDEGNSALNPLKHIHEPFKAEPLLLSLKEGQEMDNFLRELPSKYPYLVMVQGDGQNCTDEAQVFLILEKDVLFECQPINDYSIFISSLVSLLSVYYAFNLEYAPTWKNLFKILEEHVLGILAKRKSYSLKQLENRLLSKLNAVNNST